MRLPKDDAETLSARWIEGVLLKRDVFSTVERGRFRGQTGEVDAVLRRLDAVPWWSYLIARHLFARERRALARAKGLEVGPELLWAGRRALVRGFIDGVALHLAKPRGDVAYFRSAKSALNRLHRAGICHNDLAKEQNWLVGRDSRAYLTDFQLAACFAMRSRLFRIAAYEDLRHLLEKKLSGRQSPPAAALLFSCNGRGTRLFPEPNHDAGVIQELCGLLPLAGFFAQGELGPVSGRNHIHGFTASVALW